MTAAGRAFPENEASVAACRLSAGVPAGPPAVHREHDGVFPSRRSDGRLSTWARCEWDSPWERCWASAVERNRIKRRMREAVATSWPAEQAPIDVVFNPRKSVLTVPFARMWRRKWRVVYSWPCSVRGKRRRVAQRSR